ncbi:hypothetical protein FEP36_05813 [Burkholderia multivorans]|nr:hypothetical protein [Burkholderia multivorans]
MLVPIIATCWPARVAPAANVATAASTPPATSGVPARSPSRSVHCDSSPPTISVDSTSRSGIIVAGMPSMSSASSDHSRRAMSYTPPMLPAELWSTAISPVSR